VTNRLCLILMVLAATAVAIADEPKKPDAKPQSIVEITAGDKQISILAAALKTAGLVEMLSGDGPFTLFAPTNDAFDILGKDALEKMLKDKDKLNKILMAHIVKG